MLIFIFVTSLCISSLLATLALMPFIELKNLGNIASLIQQDNPNLILGLKLAQVISAIGAFIVPACLFAFFTEKNILNYLRLNSLPSKLSLIASIILMLCASPLINWMAEINGKMSLPGFMAGIEQWMKASEDQAAKLTEAFLKMNSLWDFILNIIIVGLLAAIGEEFFFRGVLQKVLITSLKGTHKGIWLTAILFSAFHMQFYGFFPRMFMGAMLGYLFVWSDSLWLPIITHFVNNSAAVIFAFLAQKNIIPKDVDTLGTREGESMYITASFIIVFTLIFLIYGWEKNKARSV